MSIEQENEWIDWNGGECPVDHETAVQVLLRSETREKFDDQVCRAAEYIWKHDGASYDIIAYRIVRES